MLFTLKYP